MSEQKDTPAIVWFRRDSRLRDNPALTEALSHHKVVVPVFLWAPNEDGPWAPGAASRYWLHQSLRALGDSISGIGGRLILRSGENALKLLRQLVKDSGATTVYWNRRYEPATRQRDEALMEALKGDDVECHDFNGSLLLEPWESRKKDDTPYRVYTPFANNCRKQIGRVDVLPAPKSLPELDKKLASDKLDSWELEPEIDWAGGIADAWTMGEEGAQSRLKKFIKDGLATYEEQRNFPANNDGVSQMSPYLHFGEISVRQVWCDVKNAQQKMSPAERKSANVYLSELLWREFSYHLLHHFPDSPESPLRKEFEQYPWTTNKKLLQAWQRGKTGYPIVDAGMRQLWKTGWMHNRVRMIVGSFLIKDLGIDWQTGEKWFWDTLVDADLAQNAMNWQWVAGCGADASPFFRVFNPVTQGKKFDPEGDYVREFVPELKSLPKKWIHAPFEAPPEVLAEHGITLGETYPEPVVDHGKARETALENYQKIR